MKCCCNFVLQSTLIKHIILLFHSSLLKTFTPFPFTSFGPHRSIQISSLSIASAINCLYRYGFQILRLVSGSDTIAAQQHVGTFEQEFFHVNSHILHNWNHFVTETFFLAYHRDILSTVCKRRFCETFKYMVALHARTFFSRQLVYSTPKIGTQFDKLARIKKQGKPPIVSSSGF